MNDILAFSTHPDAVAFKAMFFDLQTDSGHPASYTDFFFAGDVAREFWLSMRDEGPAGAVAAFRSPTDPRRGYVGLFTAASAEEARSLLDAATRWLEDGGVTQIVGPVDRSTWFQYRLSVEEPPRCALQPILPPCRPIVSEAFREAGFCEREQYASVGFPRAAVPLAARMLARSYQSALANGYRVEPVTAELFQNLLPEFYALSCGSFQTAAFFEPICFAEFARLFAKVPSLAIYPYSQALFVGTSLRGFLLAFVLENELIVKSVACASPATDSGLRPWSPSQALLHVCLKNAAAASHIQGVTAALLHQDASSNFLVKQQASHIAWRRGHVLYERYVSR